MVQHFMTRRLAHDDAAFHRCRRRRSAVAAVQRGEIDALVNVDPMISLLESQGLIKVVADTRTSDGTRQVFGGPYPAAVLYTPRTFVEKSPRTTQALVNAFVRGLRWMTTPFGGRDRGGDAGGVCARQQAALRAGDQEQPADVSSRRPLYREGAETASAASKVFDPDVRNAKIDVSASYTDAFVEKALADSGEREAGCGWGCDLGHRPGTAAW